MATVALANGYVLDMKAFNLSWLLFGDGYYRAPKLFGVYEGDYTYAFIGSNFHYDKHGYPTSGTVKSIGQYYGSDLVFAIDDISVAGSKLVSAALTAKTSDDQAAIAYALRGDDKVFGADGSDRLYGYEGRDKVLGYEGQDTLNAGSGNDTLTGGADGDRLYGGSGADHFVYSRISDSANGLDERIYDFSTKEHDKIDLSHLDASTLRSGQNDADYIGTHAFDGTSGELRWYHASGHTFIEIDNDGDMLADFVIRIEKSVSLHKGDFII